VVLRCRADSNTAETGGGFHASGNAVLRDCAGEFNQATWGGGAAIAAGARLEHCGLSNNVASTEGAGVYVATGTVDRCDIRHNSSGGGGGGASILSAVLQNSVIVENQALGGGGGVNGMGGDDQINVCTVAGNKANAEGGGLLATTPLLVRNSIVYGNTSAGTPFQEFSGPAIQFLFCCLGSPGIGVGNLVADPRFAGGAAGSDYHLTQESPCVDYGDDPAVTNDVEGVPRPLDGNGDRVPRLDVGAYELASEASDTDGDGLPDGWEVTELLNPLSSLGDDGADGDPDGDGMRNRDERTASTHPNDADSVLAVVGIERNGTDIRITAKGGTSSYEVFEFRPNLSDSNALWTALLTNFPPMDVTNIVVHPGGGTNRASMYRVRSGQP
jgi:hypothetical protein